MKLTQFREPRTREPRVGIVVEEAVFDLRLAGDFAALETVLFGSVAAVAGVGLDAEALQTLPERLSRLRPDERTEWRHPLAELELLAPVRPPSFRDFYAFEEHVRNARRRRG